jgi:hypothetical protein
MRSSNPWIRHASLVVAPLCLVACSDSRGTLRSELPSMADATAPAVGGADAGGLGAGSGTDEGGAGGVDAMGDASPMDGDGDGTGESMPDASALGDSGVGDAGGGSVDAHVVAPPPVKFVGNTTTAKRVRSDIIDYWDQLTPENEGKWGEVELLPGLMLWDGLDAAYAYAKQHVREHRARRGHHALGLHQRPNLAAQRGPRDQFRAAAARDDLADGLSGTLTTNAALGSV